MNIKKIIFYAFFVALPIDYSLFCPKDELRQIKLSNDTVWSTPEIFQNQDGAIIGLYIPKIQLILRGQNIIMITGPHKLFLTDLTILPDNPDVFFIEDDNAEVIIENCKFIIDGKKFNLDFKNIKIIGDVEFVGLNPGIIKRALGSVISWMFTEALAERFVLDYPYVIIPHSTKITGAEPYFIRTILERYPHFIQDKPESKIEIA